MRVTIRAAYAFGLAAAIVLTGCQSSSPELAATKEYAKTIHVKDFRETRRDTSGGGIDIMMVGPTSASVIDAITASDMRLGPMSSDIPNNDPAVEALAFGKTNHLFHKLVCMIDVRRLRQGVDPGEYRRLTPQEEEGVKAARLMVLDIRVFCLPPASATPSSTH